MLYKTVRPNPRAQSVEQVRIDGLAALDGGERGLTCSTDPCISGAFEPTEGPEAALDESNATKLQPTDSSGRAVFLVYELDESAVAGWEIEPVGANLHRLVPGGDNCLRVAAHLWRFTAVVRTRERIMAPEAAATDDPLLGTLRWVLEYTADIAQDLTWLVRVCRCIDAIRDAEDAEEAIEMLTDREAVRAALRIAMDRANTIDELEEYDRVWRLLYERMG